MRMISVLALASSALALAACAGGGGDSLSAAGIRADVAGVCGINTSGCIPSTGTGTTTPIADADGDGIPDDQDTDGTTGSGAGGNTTNLSTGNKAVVLQAFKYDTPTSGQTAFASLQDPSVGTALATKARILSTSKPTSLIHTADTNSANNNKLPTKVTQTEYLTGTRDTNWIGLQHHNFNLGAQVIGYGGTTATKSDDHLIGTSGGNVVSYDGYPVLSDGAGGLVVWDRTTANFKTATRNLDPTLDPDGSNLTAAPDFIFGSSVDMTSDQYWNQIAPFMDAKANGGAGANYREYRALSVADNRDELLQVWAWKNSYAAQYQNASAGVEPKQQVWSFDGNDTTNMPLAGTANYKGRFVAAAKTSNWVKPDTAALDPNSLWRVEGNSNFDVNFNTANIKGTLTSESWQTYQKDAGGNVTIFTGASGHKSVPSVAFPDYDFIYDTKILVDANMTGTRQLTDNKFSGTAKLDSGYLSGDNPVYGGFYGNAGTEMTGVFNVSGTNPTPIGGSNGVNQNLRGYLTINGAFNADCTAPTATCAP